MQFFANLFLLAHQLRTTIGLRVLDNGIGPPLYGAEGSIVNYALLDGDQKEILPSQVQAHSAFDISGMLNLFAPLPSSPSARLQLQLLC